MIKIEVPSLATELGEIFRDEGYELDLVGGYVRDTFMGIPSHDLDLATDAPPSVIREITANWADALWDSGERFGTVGIIKNSNFIEITTYRTETYDLSSRKPVTDFVTSLEDDLIRRDFTINAIAVNTITGKVVDPFGGLDDISNKILRTPQDPEKIFSEDPLRMMRAARFIAKYDLTPENELIKAINKMVPRLSVVSVERISMELEKLLVLDKPYVGLVILDFTGILDQIGFPSDNIVNVLFTDAKTMVGNSLTRRLACLLLGHNARHILRKLRFPNYLIRAVASITDLHPRLADYKNWTDANVREFILDAGKSIEDIVSMPGVHRDSLMARIDELDPDGTLCDPVLDGREICEILGIEPGPEIGQVLRFLRDYTVRFGKPTKKEAIESLNYLLKESDE